MVRSNVNYFLKPKSRKKSKGRIRPVSKKQSQRLRLYLKARKEYLQKFPYCQWFCHYNNLDYEEVVRNNGYVRMKFEYGLGMAKVPLANQIHHKRGRIGSLLTDQEFFMAVCDIGHVWIHNHTGQSYELGYMLPR